jgi:hypothetical protein
MGEDTTAAKFARPAGLSCSGRDCPPDCIYPEGPCARIADTTPAVDTSSEAVEALATAVEALPKGAPDDAEILAEWAATLRALAAERDAAIARAEAAEAERDALRAVADAPRAQPTPICVSREMKMSRKLKVYAANHHGTHRVIVAAPSRAAALIAFNAVGLRFTAHYMRGFCSETGNEHEIALATTSPGAVYIKSTRHHGAKYAPLTPKD